MRIVSMAGWVMKGGNVSKEIRKVQGVCKKAQSHRRMHANCRQRHTSPRIPICSGRTPLRSVTWALASVSASFLEGKSIYIAARVAEVLGSVRAC